MRNTRLGFTLLEVLISMSLFTVLGLGVVLLMSTGVDMWLAGTRASIHEDQTEEGWPRLVDDLRHVLVPSPTDRIPFDPEDPDPQKLPDPLPPENRFISGYMLFPFGDTQVRCRYVAFVRDIVGLPEIELFDSRAGQDAEATAYIDGKDDEEEFKARKHRPTGGQVEVLWIWLPHAYKEVKTDEAPELGIGTVYRAYRSPIGGEGTLLNPENYDALRKIRKVVQPKEMLDRVTLFDVLFWTQFTTTWQWSRGEPRVTARPQDPESAKLGRQACGPSRIWDSTRGILVTNNDLGFRLNKGAESFNSSRDDIWPRAVRIELARAEERTVLVDPFSSSDLEFVLDDASFATGRGDISGSLMKIGTEWLTVSGRQGNRTDIFIVDTRGERGTSPMSHGEGEHVYFGRVQVNDINIPAFRDDNN